MRANSCTRSAGLAIAHDAGLLEIEVGADQVGDQNPQGDALQIGRGEDAARPPEQAARGEVFVGLIPAGPESVDWGAARAATRPGGPLAQGACCQQGGGQEGGGDQEQIGGAQHVHQALGDDRPGDRAGAAARGDQTVEALGLVAGIGVGHHAPEQRHREQVEHADPDEECPRRQHPDPARGHEQPEQPQAGDEERVDDRDDVVLLEARRHPAEQRHGGHHDEKDDHKQRLQPLPPDCDGHLLAHRPDHVVARQHAEEERERPDERRDLAALDVSEAAQSGGSGVGGVSGGL
jgi:hypothetical protein